MEVENLSKYIGGKIKFYRNEKKLTQEELAKKIGVSEESYRLKEKGDNQFKSDEMFIIAMHYGKTMEEIFLPTKYTKSKQPA